MKTSTIVWTLAVLIVLIGTGAYFYLAAPANAPAPAGQVNISPNPSGTSLPAGDMTPTLTTPIASSTVSGSSSVNFQ